MELWRSTSATSAGVKPVRMSEALHTTYWIRFIFRLQIDDSCWPGASKAVSGTLDVEAHRVWERETVGSSFCSPRRTSVPEITICPS